MNFRYDNRFFTALGKIIEVLWASILWIVFSIPVLTIGASSTALYFTIHKPIIHNEGYIFKTFWEAFRSNFVKSTIKWIICLILVAFLSVDILLVRIFAEGGHIIGGMIYPLLIILVFALMWIISVFAYSARFEDTVVSGLWKGAVIAAANLGWMIFLLVILAMALFVTRYLPAFTILLPGAYCCLVYHVFEHIYKRFGWIVEEPTPED